MRAIKGDYDDADARTAQGRNLIAEGFPAAGRHEHQGVTPVDDVGDDLLLLSAERGEAEDRMQDGEGLRAHLPVILSDHADGTIGWPARDTVIRSRPHPPLATQLRWRHQKFLLIEKTGW